MSWRPNDLLTDVDLVAYESGILTRFNRVDWENLRTKAMEDWLWPQLRQAEFEPERFRTRHRPAIVWGYTSSAYTDRTTAATNTTADDLNLAAILAASSDAIVVGSSKQFRGVSVRMLDSVSSASATLTVELWRDGWRSVDYTDGTLATAGKPFSRGGAITWGVPPDWVVRPLSTDTTPYYYARLRLSSAPTSATAGQVSVIQRSVLTAPLTYRALAMIFREAPMQQDGPWESKALYYENQADVAMTRALSLVASEFDVSSDDVVDSVEETQVATPFRFFRT